ncbi:efflux RND transporter periplasmic adaptor subunit [Ralstonia pseudosolanacearum]|uniref:efflux RND transporter periplasmic adaptor subunit n=1 Tax=Ralstonia pseudosolanacearum TaxID=1310165 RepID=UPI0006BD0F6F|nr:efflux RND transporter periplasmic adaptor subunit [Ralstonia pseudosolanacearum]AKZ28658.1 hemolysin D [Ralstonia solanacearum]BCI56280.1 efflux RND transporter subunit [Ralstonia solanacearum]BCI56318.1 efflux RND transporter subunit [Ralstonia solanacearum]BCI56357.1 efflux RND transporter subunit [Ralstonia solanacearum]BCL95218.1 secretion protein HlyD [Ralstonia solanacearum]
MNKRVNLPAAIFGRKVLIPVALSAVMAATAMLVFVPKTSATAMPEQPAAALTVTVTAASQAQWPATLEASGAIAPWQEAVIGAQVSGLRLADVRVNVGDQVKRGQVLAVFDADLLRADEARLKATWQQAEANRQRALQLKGSGAISEQDVLQYTTQADVAKAQLRSTQLQLRYAEVVAPDDGVISARSATLGTVSNSGQELFRMIRQSRLEWRGELTSAQLAQIQAGQRIRLALPDGTAAGARVRQTAPSLDSQTRLGLVYADIEPGSGARAGMYAKGNVVLAQSTAVTVPAASVVIRDGRSYVPRLSGTDKVALQAVTVGRRQDDAVEIVSGIAAGDKVVVQGAAFLNDGDIVRVSKPAQGSKV